MNDLSILDQTILKQRRASDPKASAFVAANAGSGKTFVLVQRILRLLVEGVDPSRILALTYTTAAAANMSNRVFKDLSDWVRLDDIALAEKLRALDGIEPDAARLRLARQLFARAIETPGGLKIQTIHAFCERVLHLFPFEANVPAGFEVLDEDRAKALLQNARNQIIHGHALTDNAALADALRRVADEAGEAQFDDVIQKALRYQNRIRTEIADEKGLDAFRNRLAVRLAVDPQDASTDIDAKIFSGRLTDTAIQEFAAYLAQSDKATDNKLSQTLLQSCRLEAGQDWNAIYFDIFFTKDGTPKADRSLGTKYVSDKRPDIFSALLEERNRLAALLEQKRAILAIERTSALMIVTRAIISAYEFEKARMGVLDFSDLVERTRILLKRTSAQWILYKLDKGIDHLLIDEAQDTSPEQWDVLERLTDEFFSGQGARSLTRTVFAVGDPKQSIYSFQGADPKKFAEYQTRFKRKVQHLTSGSSEIVHHFYNEILTLSFRSVPDVLSAVDYVFSAKERFDGLDHEAVATSHSSKRLDAPGRVELWDVIQKDKPDISENWLTPLDRPDDGAPSVELARRIAAHIASLVAPESSERIEDKPGQYRSIIPGDVLVLVRKRGVFFETVIRALKDLGLPVAGADRLKLASHIAVMDLVALGQAILTPDDDLTLATVLKSPLIGLDDDDLLALCHAREGSLIETFLKFDASSKVTAARKRFERYCYAAKHKGPFGFYSFVLGSERGRARLRARLGREAEDAIDEFLRLALEHDHGETPSLTQFLAGFSKAEREVRRDMESGRNEIRVMTVHGAKGLEAPIVYLPDTCSKAVGKGLDPVFDLDEHDLTLLWTRGEKNDSALMASMRQNMLENVRREHRRLLYVALTRARDRLYISGFAGDSKLPDDCWYNLIKAGLSPHLVTLENKQGERIHVLQSKAYPESLSDVQSKLRTDPLILPDWLTQPAPDETPVLPPLKPSSAVDAADRSDRPIDLEFARMARRRGNLIHTLLEVLPEIPDARRNDVGSAWLLARARDLSERDRAALLSDALKLLRTPDLTELFGANSRAEAPLVGTLKRDGKPSRLVSGQVDRIAVLPREVLIADYKTAARTPLTIEDIPAAYIAQLAAYRALIAALYPSKNIRCILIYTSGPTVFEIDTARLDMSLAQIA